MYTYRWVLARRGGVLATAALRSRPIASIPPYIADDGEVMIVRLVIINIIAIIRLVNIFVIMIVILLIMIIIVIIVIIVMIFIASIPPYIADDGEVIMLVQICVMIIRMAMQL